MKVHSFLLIISMISQREKYEKILMWNKNDFKALRTLQYILF